MDLSQVRNYRTIIEALKLAEQDQLIAGTQDGLRSAMNAIENTNRDLVNAQNQIRNNVNAISDQQWSLDRTVSTLNQTVNRLDQTIVSLNNTVAQLSAFRSTMIQNGFVQNQINMQFVNAFRTLGLNLGGSFAPWQ